MKKNHTGRALLLSAAALTAAGGFCSTGTNASFEPEMDASHQISRCLDHSVWLDVGNKQHLSVREKQGDQQAQLKWGTLLPTFFWIAQLGSFAFPGAKGLEAEFPHLVPKIGPVRLNEAPFSLTMLSVLGLGYVLEKRASV